METFSVVIGHNSCMKYSRVHKSRCVLASDWSKVRMFTSRGMMDEVEILQMIESSATKSNRSSRNIYLQTKCETNQHIHDDSQWKVLLQNPNFKMRWLPSEIDSKTSLVSEH